MLLAQIVMQMLERFFIAVGLLQQAGQNRIDRRTLESDCIALARRVSRLYGLNAPEFFDARLFHNFVETLIARGAVSIDANGKLAYADVIGEVTRASSVVLPTEFRLAVLRAQPQREPPAQTDFGRRGTSVNVEPHAASENLPVRSANRRIVHGDASRPRVARAESNRPRSTADRSSAAPSRSLKHLRRLARQRVLVARGKHRIEIDRVEACRFRQHVAHVGDAIRSVHRRRRSGCGRESIASASNSRQQRFALHHQHVATERRERHAVETESRHAVEHAQIRDALRMLLRARACVLAERAVRGRRCEGKCRVASSRAHSSSRPSHAHESVRVAREPDPIGAHRASVARSGEFVDPRCQHRERIERGGTLISDYRVRAGQRRATDTTRPRCRICRVDPATSSERARRRKPPRREVARRARYEARRAAHLTTQR